MPEQQQSIAQKIVVLHVAVVTRMLVSVLASFLAVVMPTDRKGGALATKLL